MSTGPFWTWLISVPLLRYQQLRYEIKLYDAYG